MTARLGDGGGGTTEASRLGYEDAAAVAYMEVEGRGATVASKMNGGERMRI